MPTAAEVYFRCLCGSCLSAPEDAKGRPGECPACKRVVAVPEDSLAPGALPASSDIEAAIAAFEEPAPPRKAAAAPPAPPPKPEPEPEPAPAEPAAEDADAVLDMLTAESAPEPAAPPAPPQEDAEAVLNALTAEEFAPVVEEPVPEPAPEPVAELPTEPEPAPAEPAPEEDRVVVEALPAEALAFKSVGVEPPAEESLPSVESIEIEPAAQAAPAEAEPAPELAAEAAPETVAEPVDESIAEDLMPSPVDASAAEAAAPAEEGIAEAEEAPAKKKVVIRRLRKKPGAAAAAPEAEPAEEAEVSAPAKPAAGRKFEPRGKRDRPAPAGKKPAAEAPAVPCPKCEAEIPAGEEACPGCGAARPPMKRHRVFWTVLPTVVLLLVLFAVAVFTPTFDSVLKNAPAVQKVIDRTRAFVDEKFKIRLTPAPAPGQKPPA